MLSTQLRSEFAKVGEIVMDNADLVRDLYNQCLELSFDDDLYNQSLNSSLDDAEPRVEIEHDLSHEIFCVLVAVALLHDQTEIEYPIEYSHDDDELVKEIAFTICLMLTLDAMAEKKIIYATEIDGELYYTHKNDTVQDD